MEDLKLVFTSIHGLNLEKVGSRQIIFDFTSSKLYMVNIIIY